MRREFKQRIVCPHPKPFFEMFYQKFVLFSFPTFRNSISSPSRTTALMYSAIGGHLEICKQLVSSKADLAARGWCGRCQRCSRFSLNQSHPLACSQGNTALKWAMGENKSDVVAFLRGIGAPQLLHAAVTCNSCDNKTRVISQTR
jgi:ankyrin repeat protein